MKLPLVSVILPTFNRGLLVKEAVSSVLNQTYSNIELIVVDDGSTDGTQAILAALNDLRLVYIYQEKSGRSAARNLAISKSNGELIAFIDSDDLFYPNKTETQVNYFIRNPSCNMIYTAANCVDQNGTMLKNRFRAKSSGNLYSKISFLKPVTVALPTVMIRKSVLKTAGLFDTSLDRFEDIDMWRRIAKLNQIVGLDIPTCDIRTHRGNHLLSQDPLTISKAISHYEDKVFKEDKEISDWKKRVGLGRLYYYYGTNIRAVEDWKDIGNSLLKKSFQLCFIFRLMFIFHLLKKQIR